MAISDLRLIRITIAALLFGLGLELWLIEHYEDVLQFIPLLCVALAGILLIADRYSNAAWIRKSFRALLIINAICAVVGVYLHLKANFEFEKEIYVNETTLNLLINSFSGALPVFAPGSLIILSLLGMLYLQLTSKN